MKDIIDRFDSMLETVSKRASYSWAKSEIDAIKKAFPGIKERYFIVDGAKKNYNAWDPEGKVNDLSKRGVGILDLARAFVNKNKNERFKIALLIKPDIRPGQSKREMYHVFSISKL